MKHGLGRNIKTTKDQDFVVLRGSSAQNLCSGWSSYTTSVIMYKIYGGFLFIQFHITGTSNATSATITLNIPVNNKNIYDNNTQTIFKRTIRTVDNGGTPVHTLMRMLLANSNRLVLEAFGASGALFTASGTKSIQGQLIIPIN